MNDEIDYIIDKFNFERVHIAMTAVDWRWAKQSMVPVEVPDVARLKQAARHMLQIAYEEKTTVASGGFHASYLPAIEEPGAITHSEGMPETILSLKFVLAEVYSTDYRDD